MTGSITIGVMQASRALLVGRSQNVKVGLRPTRALSRLVPGGSGVGAFAWRVKLSVTCKHCLSERHAIETCPDLPVLPFTLPLMPAALTNEPATTGPSAPPYPLDSKQEYWIFICSSILYSLDSVLRCNAVARLDSEVCLVGIREALGFETFFVPCSFSG